MATIRNLEQTINQSLNTPTESITSLVQRVNEAGDDTTIATLVAIRDAILALPAPDTTVSAAIASLSANMATYEANRHNDMLTLISNADTNALMLNSNITNVITASENILTAIETDIVPKLTLGVNAAYAIRTAIYATACACSNGSPVFEPPFDTTVPSSQSTHCLRVQFVLDKMRDGICQVTTTIANGASVTLELAAALLGAGIIPGIDIASIPSGLLAALLGAVAALSAARVSAICDWLDANYEGLVNAIYNAQSASDAASAWRSYVDANTNAITELDIRGILDTIPWSGILNVIYGPAELDTSAYSPNCGASTTGCAYVSQLTFLHWQGSDGYQDNRYLYTGPIPGADIYTTLAGFGNVYTASVPAIYQGTFQGWTIENNSSGTITGFFKAGVHDDAGAFDSYSVAPGATYTFPYGVTVITIGSATELASGEAAVCPPGA